MTIESHISSSEVFWKSGDTTAAINSAKSALECNPSYEQSVALWIFIARAESKLENYEESNKILRKLISEQVYLPPVILTLFYNSLKQEKHDKAKGNIDIVKLFLPD